MDTQNEGERENQPERNSNTEYLPTKCRVTRPPPPKPATNPLQFIKVAPCPLYRKAQEQIKKVEEIKTTRQHVREEAEDWQQNLDNWKSSRRKRQEHIIERVVEVKKFEQQEQENARRKSKTFSEIVEERSKGRPKFTIPILYEDDPNDLSDYGIGSNSSKTNSVKDADTDDSSSFLDEKDQGVFDSSGSSKDANVSSNQSQSEDETNSRSESNFPPSKSKSDIYTSVYSNFSNGNRGSVQKLYKTNTNVEEPKQENEVYTYEGAIQDYRSRIKSKINVSDTIFNRKEFAKPKEIEPVLSKGQIFKRKEIFEVDKPIEIHHYESGSAKRLSEDFPQSQSIKERLQNFEKCAEQQSISNTTTRRQQTVNKPDDRKNNNVNVTTNINKQQQTQDDNKRSVENKTSRIIYDEIQERSSSPETELYMNKLNSFNNDLDNLMCMKQPSNGSRSELDDISSNYNYSCSDREDSGIHTADVSCAVSQADEFIENEYPDANRIIPNYLEKLNIKKTDNIEECRHTPEGSRASELTDTLHHEFTKECLIKETERFLEDARFDSTQNQIVLTKETKPPVPAMAEIQFDIYSNPDFLVAPPKVIEPPKAKPPPPPPSDSESEQSNLIRLNSTKRIKKEIHLKRSSFLGLGESYEDQLDLELTLDKPPDINTFLQKESKFEKTLYKKMLENLEGGLSKVESQDSGLDIERGRLSSDTWCSSIGDSSSLSHGRQDSEEDEIMKKEREIIELVEKEEKSRDKTDFCSTQSHYSSPHHHSYPSHSSDQDSEVLKVEHELLQLEKEQLKHQRGNFLLRTQHKNNRRSLDNICDTYDADAGINYRKSMPELQFVTKKEFSKTMSDIPILDQHQYRKSMPDIQQAYYKNTNVYQKTVSENNIDVMSLQHRKSLPELKSDFQRSAFYSPQMHFWQPIMPEKPSRAERSREIDFPAVKPSRNSIPNLNAPSKTVTNDKWIQPRQTAEAKNYSQHWLYQEAELRRLSEQQLPNKNRSRQDKPLPDSVIKSLTQRVQNKARMENSITKDYSMQQQQQPHTYLNHQMQQLDHALPMSYRSPLNTEENQDRMLSVSGKKKCSYCGNELGRGAAMIIESLCLFYHMECFKCCVCHVQLGDGLMGTDVRVRNQKLHCHNCYSSDDGVKFSCV